jgi:hypothetical protein
MAIRIQLRRDTAANWAQNNPTLRSGEIGIETDTLKFKVGNGTHPWNSITSYAFKPGQANGVATLNSLGKLNVDQLPDNFSIGTDIETAVADAISALSTSSIAEGSKLFFTNQRAIDANATIVSNAILTAAADATSKSATAKSEAISSAATYTDTKTGEAEQAAIIYSVNDTQNKIDTLEASIPAVVQEIVDTAITVESGNRSSAINSAISTEISARNSAINSSLAALTTDNITEASNLYFTEQRAKDAVALDISSAIAAIPAPIASFTGKTTDDLSEGATNKYFTSARVISATNNKFNETLTYAAGLVDDLRTEINTGIGNSLDGYVPEADRNQINGFAGLNSSGKVLDSVLPDNVAKLDGAAFTGDVSTTNLTITGDLTVQGTTTTVNSTNLEVTDPLIYVGTGNTGNASDIGIVGHFDNGLYQHSGIVRDASDGIWKLFSGVTTEPSSTIDFTGATYDHFKVGTLIANDISIGAIDASDLAHLDGVTSSIQTQLDEKATIVDPTFIGTVTIPAGASISGYLRSDVAQATYLPLDADLASYIDLTSYATTANVASSYLSKIDAESDYLTKLDAASSYATLSSLSSYITQSSADATFATLTSLSSVETKADNALVYGYHGKADATAQNKISYGTSSTPDILSPVAGDIYIQY